MLFNSRAALLQVLGNGQAFTCAGPGIYGGCSREPATDVLPCEGYVLQTRSGPGRLDNVRLTVLRSGPACPLRCFELGLL